MSNQSHFAIMRRMIHLAMLIVAGLVIWVVGGTIFLGITYLIRQAMGHDSR